MSSVQCPSDFWKSTHGSAAREALAKVQPVPLAAKKVEERLLLKEVKTMTKIRATVMTMTLNQSIRTKK